MSGAKFSSVSIVTVNSMALAPLKMSFHEANGTNIAVSGLACRLQFVSRSIFKAKLCKGGNSYGKVHSIWNIGSESFGIAYGIVGDGSDGWPRLPG
jgi:hypothetical protein